MPDSNNVTPLDSEELIGTEPVQYDPAILAALLRSMGKIELELLSHGLTEAQRQRVLRLRQYRSII